MQTLQDANYLITPPTSSGKIGCLAVTLGSEEEYERNNDTSNMFVTDSSPNYFYDVEAQQMHGVRRAADSEQQGQLHQFQAHVLRVATKMEDLLEEWINDFEIQRNTNVKQQQIDWEERKRLDGGLKAHERHAYSSHMTSKAFNKQFYEHTKTERAMGELKDKIHHNMGERFCAV